MKLWSPKRPLPRQEDPPASFSRRTVLRCGDVSRPLDLAVAIPVREGCDRLEDCIDALTAALADHPRAGVVLAVDGAGNASARKALSVLAERDATAIVIGTALPPAMATVGWARRLALDTASQWAVKGAVLMTTDADARVAPDWVAANLALLHQGADLVCGRITAEVPAPPTEPDAPAAIAREHAALSLELDARLDPRPHDPWPHHGRASAASLAVRAGDYRAVGRMPPLPSREGRAFAAAAERHDLRVRHADAPLVVVPPRRRGVASDGAAGARFADPYVSADLHWTCAAVTARRAGVRAALRDAWTAKRGLEALLDDLGLAPTRVRDLRRAKTFGALWAEVEAEAEGLAPARLRPGDLARDLPELRRLVARAASGG